MSTTKTTNTSTTPTFSAAQSQLQDLLASSLGTNLQSGGMTPGLQAGESAAIGSTNNMYAGLSQRLQQSLSGKGFGTSGKAVTGQVGLDVGRINSIGQTEDQFAGMAQQQQNTTLQQALQFGFADPGSNSTQTQKTGGFGTVLSSLLQAGGLAAGLAFGGGGGMFGKLMGGGAGGNIASDMGEDAGYGE